MSFTQLGGETLNKEKAWENLRFTQKVLELGENERAARMCRHMLQQLKGTDDLKLECAIRALLIAAMTQGWNDKIPTGPILSELDQIFTGFLTINDKPSAAKSLLQKAQFQIYFEGAEAIATASKLIGLFSGTSENTVAEIVEECFGFVFEHIPADHFDFIPFCRLEARFLSNRLIPLRKAISGIVEIDNALGEEHALEAIELLYSFYESRKQEASASAFELIRAHIVGNYIMLRKYREAIELSTEILMDGSAENRTLILFWMGQSFLELDQSAIAAMYFREVLRVGDETDERLEIARRSLEEIEAEEFEQSASDADA